MSNFIGSLVTKTNMAPTFSSASGRWTVTEAAKYVAQGAWPGSLVIDAHFNKTSLLLNGDGIQGGQNNTFLDDSSNNLTITRAGNTTQGSFNPYGDRWSNYFDGTGDYLSIPDNTALNLSGVDFTVEYFVYLTKLGVNQSTIAKIQGAYPGGYNYASSITNLNKATFAYISTGSTITNLQGATSLVAGAWYHVAAVRSGTTVSLYLNGVLDASVTSAPLTVQNTTAPVTIGYDLETGATRYLNGYLSDIRIVKGTALYTSAFTPPTAPLTAITNTSLLTCQSNRFKDSSTNNFTITKAGDVKVRPNSPYAPSKVYNPADGSSMYFDGTGDYLTAPANTGFVFGTGDFTVECWLYLNAATNGAAIIGCWSGTTATSSWLLTQGNTNTSAIRFGVSDGTTNTFVESAAGALILGTWMHVTASRASGVLKMFVNGVQQYSAAFANNINISATLGVAATTAGTFASAGYISDARVLKGTALYTSAFTPPTVPLSITDQTTLLLTGKNARIYDATGKNNLETVSNAQINTTIKKYGTGSLYLDGTNDYLSIAYNQDINITSGDFTIEGWIYFNSVASGQIIFANYNGTTSFGVALYTDTAGTINYFLGSSGTTWNIASAVLMGNVVVGQWYHFALVRSGSTFTPYLNGVAGTTTTSSSNLFNGSLPYVLGSQGTGNFSFNGYIDDFRISKIARYTAAFTPPARAHGTL